jgi:hypothetical protein
MINIYDGYNVMLRAMTTSSLPGQSRLTIRQRLASAKANDIWVFDGPNHNESRQAIYKGYKAHRKPLAQDLFSQINMFKDLLKHTPATQITVPEWEADDVIYTLVQKAGPVTVFSNDQDYVQLGRFPNVILNGVKTGKHEPRWTPLYKALVGDPADGIKGIPGFGQKAWDATAPYRPGIEDAIQHGDLGKLLAFPLPRSTLTWLSVTGNLTELQNMLLITHMWTVPEDQINAGITVGTPNPELIDSTLRQYFL